MAENSAILFYFIRSYIFELIFWNHSCFCNWWNWHSTYYLKFHVKQEIFLWLWKIMIFSYSQNVKNLWIILNLRKNKTREAKCFSGRLMVIISHRIWTKRRMTDSLPKSPKLVYITNELLSVEFFIFFQKKMHIQILFFITFIK